jgi:methionine-rich copper-binding protein CopC
MYLYIKPRVVRLLAAAAVILGAGAALPLHAQAHASLVKCNIAKGTALKTAPKTLICTFAEGLNPRGSSLRVVEAVGDGAEDDAGNSSVSFSNAHQMTVGLPKLNKGPYYVMWFTVSADDGHKAGGVMPFSIK